MEVYLKNALYILLAVTILAEVTKCESYIDEDTIVIEAAPRKIREKRQAPLGYPQFIHPQQHQQGFSQPGHNSVQPQFPQAQPQQMLVQQGQMRGQPQFPQAQNQQMFVQQGQRSGQPQFAQGQRQQMFVQQGQKLNQPQFVQGQQQQRFLPPGQGPQQFQFVQQGQQEQRFLPPIQGQGSQPQLAQQGQPQQTFGPVALLPGQSAGQAGSPCQTLTGSEGQCSSLSQCYPNMYIENQDVASLLLRNLSACAPPPPVNNYLVGATQRQLICCPGRRTTRNIDFGSSKNPEKFYEKQKLWNSIPIHLRKMVPPNVTPVPIQKYPWTVAIMQGERHHCGGSLISKFTVLTAAHCLYNLDAVQVRSLRVLLGHHDISHHEQSRATVRKVVKAIFHKEFTMRTLHNDIGLLILDYSVPMADNLNISPVKINNFPPLSGKAMIAGWGQMGWNLPAVPNLMETTIDIWSNRKCAAMYGPLAPGGITNHMICGSAVGKDACRGDSGSPLMISVSEGQMEQIGVVSWGIECGRYPSVHTRLASFFTWIQKNRLD